MVTMADKPYQSEVKYFEFMSDVPESGLSAMGLKDINGDGAVIRCWMYNARMPDGIQNKNLV
ncbi:MAG: hypothetical protein AB8G77_11785 [Rhodothermales bacterium]